MEVKIIDGDLLISGADYICHQVNVNGVMGGGVAYYVRKKWNFVFERYKKLCEIVAAANNNDTNKLLGHSQFVEIGDGKYVVNMFAENLFGAPDEDIPTSYAAFRKCAEHIAEYVKDGSRVAFPFKIASVRGGADWNRIQNIIEDAFQDKDVTIEYWRLNRG